MIINVELLKFSWNPQNDKRARDLLRIAHHIIPAHDAERHLYLRT